MQDIELLVSASWVVPIRPQGKVIENGSVAVNNGEIIAVGKTDALKKRFRAAKQVHREHHVLMPGLINAHSHAAMTLLRGYADDLPLMEWLQEHIWPVEGQWVDESFVRLGTQLAAAEMIRGGTTGFNDMYFFPDVASEVVLESGMRANIGLIVTEGATVWANDPEDYIHKGLDVRRRYRHAERVHFSFAPHAPYTVSDSSLKRIVMLAEEMQLPIHMHVHETATEVEDSLKQYGVRPLQRLDVLGLLTPLLQAVHMTQLLPEEITTLAERGVSVVHCPESNMKLASGTCPVTDLMKAGVNVALGTDGAASNNDLDLFGEMRSMAYLAKVSTEKADSVAALQALEAATINGAKALGWADRVGSLEKGKSADFISVDLRKPATWPVYSPVAQVVYAASRDQVRDVWVAGQCLMDDGQLKTINELELLDQCAALADKIRKG